MRKVVFVIDDVEYFRRSLQNQNITDESQNEILKGFNDFKAVYTLYGKEKTVDRYELTDFDGNKININELNGYQRGVVLCDCLAYFEGGNYFCNGKEPCGVIDIQEF